MTVTLTARLRALDDALRRNQAFWRPIPFHTPRPAWRDTHPELAEAALALGDAEVDALSSDNAGLWRWALELMPGWRAAIDPSRLSEARTASKPDTGRSSWHIPGRKQAQIQAFAEAIGAPMAPLLEWCSGKGHLGRHLSRRWGIPALSLDHDPALCHAGEALSAHAGPGHDFVVADALAPESARHLAGRHAIALHACGDLHRALLHGAVGHAQAIDLSPCCYYRSASREYRPFNAEAALPLSRDESHLAVSETATAGAGERRQRDAAMERKLGYLAWYRDRTGRLRAAGLKPVPAAWNRLPFEDYLRAMAERDGVATGAVFDGIAYAEIGRMRRAEVARMNLIRMVFRRPLEVWLVLDQALFLERAGYRVELSEFCAPDTTPRNILISARRR